MATDWNAYLQANPDVLADWQKNYAGTSDYRADPNAYGLYHYTNYGQAEGRSSDPNAAKRAQDILAAKQLATRTGSDQLRAVGLDPSAYTDKLNSTLDDLLQGAGSSADPYSVLNGKSAADSLINTEQSAARSQYTKQANDKLGTNYGSKLIDNHLLDNTINDILGTQRSSAQDYLDRGMKRGIYNDVGYNAGEKALDNSAQTANSSLSSLGSGVLDKYRTQANTVRDNAYGAASGYNLGTSTFNIDDYLGQGNDILSSAQKNAGGDLLGAVGGTNYFDLSNLNNSAGQAQGATGLRDNDLQLAIANRRKQDGVGRGLGSQGAF